MTVESRIAMTRIIEALIIAGLTAAITLYANIQVFEVRIANLEKTIDGHHDRPWHEEAGFTIRTTQDRLQNIAGRLERIEMAVINGAAKDPQF
jgi:hypothetical protein